MAYGHAERTIAAIRLLEAETRELLSSQDQLDPEQAQWLRDAKEQPQCMLARQGTITSLPDRTARIVR